MDIMYFVHHVTPLTSHIRGHLLLLILPHLVDHVYMDFSIPMQTPWTPFAQNILWCFKNVIPPWHNFYFHVLKIYFYVMSYETQKLKWNLHNKTILLFNYYIRKMTLGELNCMRGHQPWHQWTCVSKLEWIIPIKSNPKLNNQTRS